MGIKTGILAAGLLFGSGISFAAELAKVDEVVVLYTVMLREF